MRPEYNLRPDVSGLPLKYPDGDGWEERAYSYASWTDFDPRPRFELDRAGRLLGANGAAKELLASRVIGLYNERLRFGSTSSNRRFDRAVEAATSRSRQKLILRRTDGSWRSAEMFSRSERPSILLIFSGEAEVGLHAFAALAEAFGLTRGEARVLHALCAGSCAKEVAREMDVSEHTVRSHLRSIYGKLGVRGLSNAIRVAIQLVV